MSTEPTADHVWHALLDGQFSWEKDRKRYGLFPGRRRCKNCNAPFDGIGGWYARLTGRGQFSHNPRFCNF
jgi:adenylate cyclase